MKPYEKYDKAKELAAFSVFQSLGGYRDCLERKEELRQLYYEKGLKAAKAGDEIFFGKYEQDGDSANGKEDIAWIVLSNQVENKRIFVVSKYVLAFDSKQFFLQLVASVPWLSF